VDRQICSHAEGTELVSLAMELESALVAEVVGEPPLVAREDVEVVTACRMSRLRSSAAYAGR